jgi:hypothetical protein
VRAVIDGLLRFAFMFAAFTMIAMCAVTIGWMSVCFVAWRVAPLHIDDQAVRACLLGIAVTAGAFAFGNVEPWETKE